MVDFEKLNGAIEQSGMKVSAISKKVGINRTSLYNKISGKTEFSASEIESISDVLRLSVKERNEIFFAKKVV